MAPSSQLSPEELKENQKLAREESKAGEAQDSSLSTGVKGKTTAQAESPTLTIETIHPDNYADARKVILAWKTVKKETSHGKRRR